MLKKNKATYIIKPNPDSTKKEFVLSDDYYCVNDFKRKPVSVAFLDAYAKRYKAWADNTKNVDSDGDEPLRLSQWLSHEGVYSADHQRWCKRHEPVRIAHEYVMSRLATRREIGALKRRYDASSVARNQWKYDRAERDEQLRIEDREEKMIKLRAEAKMEADGTGSQTITVVMQPIEKKLS